MNFDYEAVLNGGSQAAQACRFAEQAQSPRGKAGFHRGSAAGSSLEYKDFREYEPGDDLRHIDWNAYARTEKMIVKRFHEEITPHLDLLVDGSASMALEGSRKAEAAVFLSAFFATVARNTRFTHGCWLTGKGCNKVQGSDSDLGGWAKLALEAGTSPEQALAMAPPRWHRLGVRVLLSDLLWLGDPTAFLNRLGEGAAAVLVVQILAATDMNPGFGGKVRLIDAESGQEQEIRLDAPAQARYRATLDRHQAAWRDAARSTGVGLVTLEAASFLAEPVFDDPAFAPFLTY